MDNSTQTASSGGISFCGLLTIVFIALKLTHYIDWSWWWVLSPMWIPITFVLLAAIIFVAFYAWLGYDNKQASKHSEEWYNRKWYNR